MLLIIALCCFLNHAQGQPTDFPGKKWMQYVTPEEAGYSSEKLDIAKKVFDESEAASVVVSHEGRILISWGETARRFRCASIRKSFLSALHGIYVAKGKIKLNQTLEELKIDDIQKLATTEKQAKVLDLITARSGVYLPSAYSPRNMEKNLPPRGSHAPGTFWYYNNWDFNTLGTIFEQKTGKGIFAAFKDDIADPLQMEDFEIGHTYYRFEPEKSKHPAYLFRMTARDMARFGLLYLNNGRWKKKQVIPAGWVKESTQPFTKELKNFENRGSYGYLWWVSGGIKGQPMYYASGSGGQRICVLPQAKLVFVHAVNTYDNNEVSDQQTEQLLELILEAKTAEPKSKPHLVEYNPPSSPKPEIVKLENDVLNKFQGQYRHRFLGEMTITTKENYLIMETGIGKFNLLPTGESQFFPEDIETPVFFEKAEVEGKRHTVASVFDEKRKVERVVFYY
jgi:CubicO group peptidase (beta-lactamase class C family)